MKTPYILWLIINWVGNAAQSFVTAMVIYLNWKILPKNIKPNPTLIFLNVLWAVVVFAYFIAWTILERPI
jgi:hypothetical protein